MLNRTFATPTLLLLAENDRIIHNEKTIKYFKKKFIHPGNRLKIYPGCAHTLEFEDKNFNFIEDILSWWAATGASREEYES
jgi:alpha-beta hydrolase superfamily lysophospholipase